MDKNWRTGNVIAKREVKLDSSFECTDSPHMIRDLLTMDDEWVVIGSFNPGLFKIFERKKMTLKKVHARQERFQ